MRGPFAFHATRDQLPWRQAVFTAPYLWSLSLYKTPVFEFSIFMNDTIFLLMVVISELYVTTDPPPLALYNQFISKPGRFYHLEFLTPIISFHFLAATY